MLAFLASIPTAEEILAFKPFKPSDVLQHRASYLVEQNREGVLTLEKREEMEEFRRMNHLVNLLRLFIRRETRAN